MVSSDLNVEFMCCILYGMTDIFMRNKNKENSNITEAKEKTHTIKYLNTIDKTISDIKSIILKVSIEKGDNLLNDNDIDYKILGNGSNLIFSDKPYKGVLIKLNELNHCEINDTIINSKRTSC